MYKLFYYPGNANFAPHMMLEEIGAAHELVLVDRSVNAHKSPDYLALNPAGRIPVLVDGDLVLYETAAICLHLADKHPEAELAPALGSPERATFYRLLMFMTNTIQAEILAFFYTDRYTTDPDSVPAVRAGFVKRLDEWFGMMNDEVGAGPYLQGDFLTAADFYLFMLVRFGRFLPDPPHELGNLAPYVARLSEHPAIVRAGEAEGLAAPY